MITKSKYKLLFLTGCFTLLITLQTAFGEDTWRTDFDETCARTNDAMALSTSELNKLIERCDRLQKIIETEEETVRKVFLKRLQMCRNLYVFVQESKMQEQKPK
jgi:hypothetical protein